MDPLACLKAILEDLTEDPGEAAEKARDLEEWLGGGGFTPDMGALDDDERRRILRLFCDGVCDYVAGDKSFAERPDGADTGGPWTVETHPDDRTPRPCELPLAERKVFRFPLAGG